MAFFLVKLPAGKGGQTRINSTNAYLVEADSATHAKQLCAAQDPTDQDWTDASVTATNVSTLSAADFAGWTYEIEVREPATGGDAGIIEKVSVVAAASDAVDDIGDDLATALNATASIANAAYVAMTNVLTIATGAGGDDLGDKEVQVRVKPPGGDSDMPALRTTIVHLQTATDPLSVVLVAPTAIPKVVERFEV